MSQHDGERDDSESGFRTLVLSIVGIAVVLGIYIVRFNAETDRERAEALDEILRCRQQNMPSHLSASDPNGPVGECRYLEDSYVRRFGFSR